ncbi:MULTISPECIES: ABC transporter ATP-binding protein [Staphylococcus]|uniref:ABC transporter ATP-binding protein n=1 Tax=Staphylococcus TaxID=1279 RepID=UPI0021D09C3C|nr:ABC transporter ATP-binding protein [Staphylococcus sp. IVB6181]UXV34620.1 ABC transporter ATP-binding protein [Staphylococcus sp. IVB6181]
MIEFKNVSKQYGNKTVVDNVSFNVEEGEFFVLIGPSGSGKTTTLKMINRLIPLTKGYIYFKDKPISDFPVYEMRWDIGYVLQQIALFPHMTVKENIAQVPQMKGWDKTRIDQRIDELLEMVNLDPDTYRDRKPDELSGGQRQRVGVVRALAADPPMILMDEPFSALDPISRTKLQEDLIELQSKIKKTIVFVTHDINEAMKLADRICLLNEGRVEQIDTPDGFLDHPKNEFVRHFISQYDQANAPRLTLETILRATKLKAIDTAQELPIVSADAPLNKVYEDLAHADGVAVEQQGQLHLLTREDVFKFLAQNKRGDVS